MDLETYKNKVKECLIKNNNFTEERADKLMKTYEDDFQEFLDKEFSPACAVTAMIMGY